MDSMPYKTKFTIEVTVSHQFSPQDITRAVKTLFAYPFVEKFEIVRAESNYRLHQEADSKFTETSIDDNGEVTIESVGR